MKLSRTAIRLFSQRREPVEVSTPGHIRTSASPSATALTMSRPPFVKLEAFDSRTDRMNSAEQSTFPGLIGTRKHMLEGRAVISRGVDLDAGNCSDQLRRNS